MIPTTHASGGEGPMTNACFPSSSPASPLENDDLLSVILLGLPPTPSSLPRASLVCKRWHRLTSDPGFLRRFHARHRRNAPIVGFLKAGPGEISFTPILDPPDRVPSGRFSLHIDGRSRLKIVSIRHGLVLIHDLSQLQLLVWDPVTGDVNGVDYPQEFFDEKGISRLKGTVLRAAGDVNCSEGSGHFQVVLVGNDEAVTKAIASIYSSKTGKWGDLISTACPMYPSPRSCILIGNSLCWFLVGLSSVGVLEFDLDRQTLALIEIPEEMSDWMGHFMIMHADDGGVGFLFRSSFTLQKWKRQADVDAGWVLGSSVELDKLLNLDGPTDLLIYGYVDENNVLLVMTGATLFEIQLDSMQLKKSFQIESTSVNCGHPYSCVYTAGI
ncbi:hypothetical protein QOZ80_2BG0161600 [Eleusine coracana subsp. coracana]|nr:hypothetical protein QOZ80_2BG0161600 [Eleusine coracana subsp. coracana]